MWYRAIISSTYCRTCASHVSENEEKYAYVSLKIRSGTSNCGTWTSKHSWHTYAVSGKNSSTSEACSGETKAFDNGDMPRSANTSCSEELQKRQRCMLIDQRRVGGDVTPRELRTSRRIAVPVA